MGNYDKIRWVLAISLSIVLSNLSYVTGATAVETHGLLSVEGNRIVNETSQPVSLAGVSLYWSNVGWGGERYYRENVVNYLQENWNAPLVRASMGVEDSGGYIQNPTANRDKVEVVIDAAITHGMYVIIDWHSHNAEDYPDEAVGFFQEMALAYGDTPNVIYEIYNEPLDTTSWPDDVKPYAERVIAAIRSIDPDNLIIVGSPTWSQDVDVASNDPITGYENIAYGLHFYAGTHTQFLRDKATTALNNGVALFVTEWGTVNADANGPVATEETERWMQFLRDNQISHCNWAFNDKAEGTSILIPGSSPTEATWPDSSLTPSGQSVKDIVVNWDSIDYDNLPRDGFSLWLAAIGLPDDSKGDDDPFNTGRSLLFDYAFGIAEPASSSIAKIVTITRSTPNRTIIRFPAMQEDIEYILESAIDMKTWAEETRVTGNGEWMEIEIDQQDQERFYRITARFK